LSSPLFYGTNRAEESEILLRISSIVIWICSKFYRTQIEYIISGLLDVLYDPSCEINPQNAFKEEHPHYREFDVDPHPPLREQPQKKNERIGKQALQSNP
jgi:hypothetical protein